MIWLKIWREVRGFERFQRSGVAQAFDRARLPVANLLALRIALQVHSALYYMRKMRLFHGAVGVRVEKFDRRGTEPIELLNIRIRAEIISELSKICQNSSEIQKFEDLSIFSKLIIEILRISH